MKIILKYSLNMQQFHHLHTDIMSYFKERSQWNQGFGEMFNTIVIIKNSKDEKKKEISFYAWKLVDGKDKKYLIGKIITQKGDHNGVF